MRRQVSLCIALAISCVAFLATGCGKSDDGLTAKDQELVSKSDQIIKKANGNWESLSPEDKAYLVKEIGYGNEHNAQMFFMAKSGKLKKGGPPTNPGAPSTSGQ